MRMRMRMRKWCKFLTGATLGPYRILAACLGKTSDFRLLTGLGHYRSYYSVSVNKGDARQKKQQVLNISFPHSVVQTSK
jgi:hypothetical protein